MDTFNWLRAALSSANKQLHERVIFRFQVQANELAQLREERKAFDVKLDALKAQLKHTEVARDSWMLTAKAFAKENDGLKRDLDSEQTKFVTLTGDTQVIGLFINVRKPSTAQIVDYLENTGVSEHLIGWAKSNTDTKDVHCLIQNLAVERGMHPLTVYRDIIDTIVP